MDKDTRNETVIFMAAYDIHKIERKLFRLKNKKKKKELWEKFHVAGFVSNNKYIAPFGICNYDFDYNTLNQVSSFHFEENIERYNEINEGFSDEMLSILSMQHSTTALLDSTLIAVEPFFNMEQFLVAFEDEIFQVEPIAFIMNGTLIITYELINFDTGVPLDAMSVLGRENNYGITPIKKIRYFDEAEFVEDTRKISDIIFDNIYGFLMESTDNKWAVGNYSFVHNILVFSNEIENVTEYFQSVLGGKLENLTLTNMSTSNKYEYYSTEYLGLVTFLDDEDMPHILNDSIILEAFKVFILLKMIITYEIRHNLEDVVNNQIYIESQLHPLHAPIVTLNFIDNFRNIYSFNRYKKAIAFKEQTLKLYQERKKSKNSRLLNILLYILAIFGSVEMLQVLQTEFAIPFKISFWVMMSIFMVFGIVWVKGEVKKQ